MLGIPNLLKKAPKAIGITLLGNAVTAVYNYFFQPPKWGIYLAGQSTPAMPVSSVVELDISGESMVSDYPIETGSFTTYNKVQRPEYFGIRVTQDGAQNTRTELLSWLKNNKEATTVFDVVCPEFTWLNVTLVSYRITRTARSGASMVSADLIFQQVREIPAQYSSSQVASPQNQQTSPTVRVSPVPDPPKIQATALPPL